MPCFACCCPVPRVCSPHVTVQYRYAFPTPLCAPCTWSALQAAGGPYSLIGVPECDHSAIITPYTRCVRGPEPSDASGVHAPQMHFQRTAVRGSPVHACMHVPIRDIPARWLQGMAMSKLMQSRRRKGPSGPGPCTPLRPRGWVGAQKVRANPAPMSFAAPPSHAVAATPAWQATACCSCMHAIHLWPHDLNLDLASNTRQLLPNCSVAHGRGGVGGRALHF